MENLEDFLNIDNYDNINYPFINKTYICKVISQYYHNRRNCTVILNENGSLYKIDVCIEICSKIPNIDDIVKLFFVENSNGFIYAKNVTKYNTNYKINRILLIKIFMVLDFKKNIEFFACNNIHLFKYLLPKPIYDFRKESKLLEKLYIKNKEILNFFINIRIIRFTTLRTLLYFIRYKNDHIDSFLKLFEYSHQTKSDILCCFYKSISNSKFNISEFIFGKILDLNYSDIDLIIEKSVNLAVIHKNIDILMLFRKSNVFRAGFESFVSAVKVDSSFYLLQFLYTYSNQNLTKHNNILFLLASRLGKLDILKYLLSLNANINPRDRNYYAFRYAERNGHRHIVEYLTNLNIVPISPYIKRIN